MMRCGTSIALSTFFSNLLAFAALAQPTTIIVGDNVSYISDPSDNIWTIAEKFRVSPIRLLAANPTISADLIGAPYRILIPKAHILPISTAKVQVDIRRRLLFLRFRGDNWSVMDASVGSLTKPTPEGRFLVIKTRQNPTWYPTPAQRLQDPSLPNRVPPGPDNPLGVRALYLNKSAYLIHGTVDDWQVGVSETDGCVELRNSDAELLAANFRPKETVEINGNTVLSAVTPEGLYLEVGPYYSSESIYRLDENEATRKATEFSYYVTSKELGLESLSMELDKRMLETAFRFGMGYPIKVGRWVPASANNASKRLRD